jgi:hypothetical protein
MVLEIIVCSNSTSNKYKCKLYSDVCEEEQGKIIINQ